MQFRVKALRDAATIEALVLEAVDESDARSQLQARGYSVLTLNAVRSVRLWTRSNRNTFPLTLFSQELLSLLDAGLTIVDAFETLLEKEARPENAVVLKQVLGSMRDGHPLSYALQENPRFFPPLYVATVRASEKTGDLIEALSRYVAYQTQVDAVRKKVVSASIYPVILLGAGGLVTLFLMIYVVPRFSRIYQDMGTDLPFASRMLLEWGQLLQAHGMTVLIVFAAIAVGVLYALSQASVRGAIMRRIWTIPTIGERMRIYELARFYRTVGMLLRGGTPIVVAMKMVSGLLPPTLRGDLDKASVSISEGRPISHAMEQFDLTTPVASRMLRVGERTGKMGEMMERIAAFYDDEMARWVDWFTRLFEPLLMAVIGLVIGFIVILMYFPIFELAGSIQ
jgi:general secretion pathway protein F